MNRLLELITDRKGKISPYKLCWQITTYSMLLFILWNSFTLNKLAEIPSTWVTFLVTVGGANLGRSYLANKVDENKTVKLPNTTTVSIN